MKKFNKAIKSILVLSALFFAGCNNFVGLGEAVDQQGPEVSVSSPELNAVVRQGFTLTGTAGDNKGVTLLQVVCNETNQIWKIDNNQWVTKKDGETEWSSIEGSSLSGTPAEYSFSVPIAVATYTDPDTNTEVSDFSFDISAKDEAGNTGNKSKVSIKVTVDKTQPVVSIIKPALDTDYSTAQLNLSSYGLQNNSCLNHLINGLFEVSGNQIEENPKELEIILDDGKDFSVTGSENIIADKKIDDSNVLRNWSEEFNVADFDEKYQSGSRIVRLVVKATDKAGWNNNNSSDASASVYVYGWFILWPEADKPWIVANFGDDSSYDKSQIYPNYNLQGQAYDDDGLKKISVQIVDEGSEIVSTQNFDLSAKNEPYYSWSLNAPSAAGKYKAVVSVTDMNGTAGDSITKYFTIKDINPPTISDLSPEAGESTLGNASGVITISGKACDDGEVSSLKIVKIAQGKEDTQLKYLDASSELWNVSSKTTDSDGNIVYPVTLSAKNWNETTKVNEYAFSQNFSLFTDFGVDGTENKKASNMIFILRAQDGGGETCVKSYSLAGDTEAPEISFDKLYVTTGSSTVSYDLSTEDLTLKAWTKNSSDAITDKVYLTGKWSDNSFDTWKNLSKINKAVVTWNGVSGITVTMNSDGTWKTNSFTPYNSTTASLTASLTDFGGNSKKVSKGFYIESNKPELSRITSTNPDGSYNAGTEIYITMEFNKSVTFSGGSGNPVLALNNGKTAVYDSGNGSSRHYFKYTVASGDDISALDVKTLTANSSSWKDSSEAEVTMTLPTGDKSLAGGRSIVIDTKAPTVSSIECLSAAGSYLAGKSIFAKLTFSEKVSVTDVSDLKLKLNSGDSVYAENATVTGDTTVMFTYTVAAGENASPLKINSIEKGSSAVKDAAGNAITTFTVPSSNPFASVIVDTDRPESPKISLTKSGTVYDTTGTTLTLADVETGATAEYSIDHGSSWSTYSKAVTLTTNGNYIIYSRQTDAAGNVSEWSDPTNVTIDKGDILTGISSTKPDGTYTYDSVNKAGDVIPITLTFRKKVTVTSGTTLTLNTKPAAYAVYDKDSSSDTVHVFNYTVGSSDTCDALEVSAINGTFKDPNDKDRDVTAYCGLPEGNCLADNRTIKIVTGIPVVQSVALSGTTLTITFNENISKNDGEITITQSSDNYKVPAVLTVSQFNEYKDTSIADYYESGTNGASSDCTPDTSEKYILKYEYDTDNTTLCSLFESAGALETSVPVASSSVTVSGAKLIISLTGSYALPVLGANYSVSVPAALVIDSLSHSNEKDSTARTITPAGVENAVIRINKSNETISSGTATQPMTAGVKIDCQTPLAAITYKTGSSTEDITASKYTVTQSVCENWWNNGTMLKSDGTKPSVSSASSVTYSSAFTLGSSSDWTNASKYLIQATATKGSSSAVSYEFACRTIVRVEARDEGSGYISGAYYIRGGDLESGGVTTPGFPFSWNTAEFDKVRMMTKKDGYWYFITWNLNVNAYIGFLCGDTPSDVSTKGPLNWCWATCAFVSSKAKYPVYPGEGISFRTSGWGDSWSNGTWMGQFQFQAKQQEHRSGGSKGTLVESAE